MKKKLLIPTIILVIILIFVVLSYFVLLKNDNSQSLTTTISESLGAPSYQPPPKDDQPYYDLAKKSIDWFEPYRQTTHGNLIPVSIRCDQESNECEPDEILSHRNMIARLWALSKLVNKTNDVEELSLLQVTTNSLFKHMLPQADGTQFIWQTEYYHCFLIDQIITTTPDLNEMARQQLSTFCSEAAGEVMIGPDTSQIATKVRYLIDFEPSSDEAYIFWSHDQSTMAILNNDYTASQDGYPFTPSTVPKIIKSMFEQNIIYLADRVVKDSYPSQTENGTKVEVDSILDSALSSYYLFLQMPDLTSEEKYIADLELLLGLQTYIKSFPTKAQTYNLSALESHLVSQLEPPDVENGAMANYLYETHFLFPLANLCFLEKNVEKPTNLVSQIQDTLLQFHQHQQEAYGVAPDEPFVTNYTNEYGHYFQIDLRDNALAAGCLVP